MSRWIPILFLLVLLVPGCRSPQYNAEDAPSGEPPADPVRAARPRDIVPPPPTTSASPAVVASKVSAPWVTMAEWTWTHELGPVVRVGQGPAPAFEIRSTHGVFRFRIRTLEAQVDEIRLLLGFEPVAFAGEPCLHARDVEMNVAPLLLRSLPAFDAEQVIVLDPGHGGDFTGTRSADGQLEKDYTLDWALRTRPLLETNGWTVFLTRTNDTNIGLMERVAFADAVSADLFISLHFNASGGGIHQAGLETYCLTPTGMPSTLTRGYEDDPARVYPNNAFDRENLYLAVRLHRALLRETGCEDRGIRRARFMTVLREQNRPAVLLEGGFLSNPAEADRIDDPDYREQLAVAVADALGPAPEPACAATPSSAR